MSIIYHCNPFSQLS